jgi:mannose-6-phosphate isomerase-like protein (cupin superfamily)
MKRIAWSAVILVVVVLTTTLIWAQVQGYPVQPRGVATDIKKADLDAVLGKMSASGGSGDEAVRTFNMAGTHYLSVALLRYAPAKPDTKPNTFAPEHDLISELYYVIKGSGTLVTGGTLENAMPIETNSRGAKELFGPGWRGTFKDAVSRKITQGDVVVIPPHTPHTILDVTSDMEILTIRIDPAKVLNLK